VILPRKTWEGGKNIPDLGGKGGRGLRTSALIFFATVYVNSTFYHALGVKVFFFIVDQVVWHLTLGKGEVVLLERPVRPHSQAFQDLFSQVYFKLALSCPLAKPL